MSIQTLLSSLRQDGMTDAEIGAEIGAPQSIVTRLRTGTHKSTSYERGRAIEALAEARLHIKLLPAPGVPLAPHDQAA